VDRLINPPSWLRRGVSVSIEFMSSIAGSASKLLMEAAGPHQAGLSIMGGYGHSHMREIVFGAFTQSVLDSAEMTILLIH
jgi:nucleotide-binding universal stress UspA family protein